MVTNMISVCAIIRNLNDEKVSTRKTDKRSCSVVVHLKSLTTKIETLNKHLSNYKSSKQSFVATPSWS